MTTPTPDDVRALVESLRRREPNYPDSNASADALESLDQWKWAVISALNPLRKNDPVYALGRDLNDPVVVIGQIEAMRDELAELRKDRDHLRTLVGIAHEAFNAAMKESNGG